VNNPQKTAAHCLLFFYKLWLFLVFMLLFLFSVNLPSAEFSDRSKLNA